MIISNIRVLMKERKVTMLSLVKTTGLAIQTIHRARGPQIAECKLSTLLALAEALGVGICDLFEVMEGKSSEASQDRDHDDGSSSP